VERLEREAEEKETKFISQITSRALCLECSQMHEDKNVKMAMMYDKDCKNK